VVGAYLLVIGRSSFCSLLDLPNHLARATVMADLMFHHGSRFGGAFHYHFMAIPYVLGDLLLAGLVTSLGPDTAGMVWECVTFLSLPCALLLYLRVARVPATGQQIALLFAAYLSTDWFFFRGFLEFRLGIAVMLVALALAGLLRRRWSLGLFALYAVVVACCYLVHLAALVFVAAAVATSDILRWWFKDTDAKTEVNLWLPILLVFAWHFGFAVHFGRPEEASDNPISWGTVTDKLRAVTWDFRRFSGHSETYLKGGFLLCLGLAGIATAQRYGSIRSWLTNPAIIEWAALALMFLGLYVALPSHYKDATFVDVRALAAASIFFVLVWVGSPGTSAPDRQPIAGAAILSVLLLSLANLAVVAGYLSSQSAWIANYRRLVAVIPQGAHVLPITPWLQAPFTHAGSLVVIDAGGLIPYLFSADNGNPMKYFRYAQNLYAPGEDWLYKRRLGAVNWQKVGCDYQFLLVVKPFDPHWIDSSATTVAENSSAALLRVDRDAAVHQNACPSPM